MAKKKAAADGEAKPIDEETMKILGDQVKKGKQRKFVLIYKGSQLKKLIVFRVGNFNAKISQARKEGFRGDALCGSIIGAGKKLRFRLAGSDDVCREMGVKDKYTDPPLKKTKLRNFLNKNEWPSKPVYEIVKTIEEYREPNAWRKKATS